MTKEDFLEKYYHLATHIRQAVDEKRVYVAYEIGNVPVIKIQDEEQTHTLNCIEWIAAQSNDPYGFLSFYYDESKYKIMSAEEWLADYEEAFIEESCAEIALEH